MVPQLSAPRVEEGWLCPGALHPTPASSPRSGMGTSHLKPSQNPFFPIRGGERGEGCLAQGFAHPNLQHMLAAHDSGMFGGGIAHCWAVSFARSAERGRGVCLHIPPVPEAGSILLVLGQSSHGLREARRPPSAPARPIGCLGFTHIQHLPGAKPPLIAAWLGRCSGPC